MDMVAEAGSLEEIQATLADNPNDAEALYGLSGYLMLNNQPEQAIQTLLKMFMVDKEFKDGASKKTLIEIGKLLDKRLSEFK